MKETYFVVNDIWIDENEIVVGATDNERWEWDIKDGESGADAKTLVFVVLELTQNGYVVEKAGFHCSKGDTLRSLALLQVEQLLDIAWDIYENKWDTVKARNIYHGHALKKSLSNL